MAKTSPINQWRCVVSCRGLKNFIVRYSPVNPRKILFILMVIFLCHYCISHYSFQHHILQKKHIPRGFKSNNTASYIKNDTSPKPKDAAWNMCACSDENTPYFEAANQWKRALSSAKQHVLPATNITSKRLESFQVKLPQKLENFRNPCWWEEVPPAPFKDDFYFKEEEMCNLNRKRGMLKQVIDAAAPSKKRLRCFPYFFLLGFAKSGTTDLSNLLRATGVIFRGIKTEPLYWSDKRLGSIAATIKCRLSTDMVGLPLLSDYVALYDLAAKELENKVVTRANNSQFHPGVLGDWSTWTANGLMHWQGISGNEGATEPRYTTAHHLYSLMPDTKLMFIIRNPISRAYSHYNFYSLYRRSGTSPQKFHALVQESISNMTRCCKNYSLRACLYTQESKAVTSGVYYVFVRDWMAVFPRKQLHFIKAEDYFKNRSATLDGILKFLDLGISISPEKRHAIDTSDGSRNSLKSKPMLNETMVLLEEFYKPFNRKLASLLGDNSFMW